MTYKYVGVETEKQITTLRLNRPGAFPDRNKKARAPREAGGRLEGRGSMIAFSGFKQTQTLLLLQQLRHEPSLDDDSIVGDVGNVGRSSVNVHDSIYLVAWRAEKPVRSNDEVGQRINHAAGIVPDVVGEFHAGRLSRFVEVHCDLKPSIAVVTVFIQG